MRTLKIAMAVVLSCMFSINVAAADEDHSIPLKLFGENILQGYDGCGFSLWQKNRNPAEDKYAYVLYAPFHDAAQMPGWMKVGDTVYEMYRQDVGDAGGGYVTPYQLFKSEDSKFWAILEVFEQHDGGNEVVIDRAELTVVGFDAFPFVIEVKGRSGCPASYFEESAAPAAPQKTYNSLYGDPVSLQLVSDYYEMSSVPVQMQRYVAQNYASCDLDNTAAYSAQYAISSAMSLWQVPCAIYARDATANFFTVLNENPEYFAPVYTNNPSHLQGFENGDLKELLNAYIEPTDGSIISWEQSSAGDCGSFWKYQLRAVEGEAVEAFLVEYRRKDSCDGNYIDPEQMPIIYIAD